MIRYVAKGFFLIAISLFFAACAPSREKPDHILSEEVMVDVLYDIYLLEGAQRANVTTIDGERYISDESSEEVLRKHGLTKALFQESLRFYAYDTEELNEIYRLVVERLNKKEAELVGAVQDSIAK